MHKLHIFIKILYFLHNILYKSRYYVKLKVQIHVVMGNNITVEIVILESALGVHYVKCIKTQISV